MMTKNDVSTEAKGRAVEIGISRCSKCNRELRFSSKYIGDHDDIVCESCYKSMAFPYSGIVCMEKFH